MSCTKHNIPSADDCCRPRGCTWAEKVLVCLNDTLASYRVDNLSMLANAVAMGDQSSAKKREELLADLQLLRDYLYDIWLERTTNALSATPMSMEHYWNLRQIPCLITYFHCKYQLAIHSALWTTGLFDPLNPPAASVVETMPPMFDGPCEELPVPPVPPPVWPPICEEVNFPALTIQRAGDNFTLTSADPSFHTGAFGLLVEQNVGGTNWVLYDGTDVGLATAITFAANGAGQSLRWTWRRGSCRWLVVPTDCPTQEDLGFFPLIGLVPEGELILSVPAGLQDPLMTVRAEALVDEAWQEVYNGTYNALITPQNTGVTGAVSMRWTVQLGTCVWGSFEDSVPSTSQCVVEPDYTVVTIINTLAIEQMLDFSFIVTGHDAASTTYFKSPVYIYEDPEGYLEGSPSQFEQDWGYPPPFQVGDIVNVLTDWGMDPPPDNIWDYTSFEKVVTVPDGSLILNEDMFYERSISENSGELDDPYRYYQGAMYPPGYDENLQLPQGLFKISGTFPLSYFPAVQFTPISFGLALLAAVDIDAAAASSHHVRVEVSYDGVTWTPTFQTTMSALTSPQNLVFNAMIQFVRVTTSYGPPSGDGLFCFLPPVVFDNPRPMYSVYIVETTNAIFGDLSPVRELQRVSDNHGPFGIGGSGPYAGQLWGQLAMGESYSGGLPGFNRVTVPYENRVSPDLYGPGANRAAVAVGSRTMISLQYPSISFPYAAVSLGWTVKDPTLGPPPSGSALYSPYLQNGLNGESIANFSIAKESHFNGAMVAVASGYPNTLVDIWKFQRQLVHGDSYDWYVPLDGLPNEGGMHEILSAAVTEHQHFCVCLREGVYWTEDAGETWTQSSGYGAGQFWTMLNTTDLFVVAVGPEGIYRSTDQGKTWVLAQAGATGYNFFAHTDDMLALGSWLSDDFGISWYQRSSPPDALSPSSFSVARINHEIIVYGSQEIWVSFDRGVTIQRHATQPPPTNNPVGFHAAMVAWLNAT